jgi:hypothetical protein
MAMSHKQALDYLWQQYFIRCNLIREDGGKIISVQTTQKSFTIRYTEKDRQAIQEIKAEVVLGYDPDR